MSTIDPIKKVTGKYVEVNDYIILRFGALKKKNGLEHDYRWDNAFSLFCRQFYTIVSILNCLL